MTAQRIYAACLAAYNNGILHGRWIDAANDADEMQEQVDAMLSESPIPDAEEWAIHDHEGLGNIGEYAGLEAVAKRVKLAELAEDRNIPLAVLMSYVEEYCSDGDDLERDLDDKYAGEFTDAGDWAAEQAENMGREIPDWLDCYIDWEGVSRDWLMDYSSYEHDGTTYLFHNY
ncbi:antirestriction protein ArdA [Hoeflea sp. G2-23]|uniref:Antirestriction protein ArdA n=1 Tax=Hoeflea algicola TaxID=2983763 RepID=A0ABT3ZAP7_9HYPH|nr:antirestriction protein ArdA [Hoeflea algicola]MCY0148326.1 antirestriction protein ArdA [Hoeflea algicola]